MQSDLQTVSTSKKMLWIGRIMSGFVVLFLAFDSAVKLMRAPMALQGTRQLGYPEGVVFPLGVVLLICTILYVVPRTSVLGAILLTGYLGGAVATHVRVGDPLFSHIFFPVYMGVILWGGLFFQNVSLRRLIPFRS